MNQGIVRIGCGAGFWGDTPEGPRQLIESGQIEYLVLDYLAEITMSILARVRERNTELGYATDFVTHVIGPFAQDIAARGIKVVANAGGVNPLACKAAIERELSARGVSLKVAAVLGDDLMPQIGALREQGVREMDTGASLPVKPLSANAYLGAFPIAAALAAGADIVVTGRCVDSAIALGPLIHEFGWTADQWDLLAAGSLVGHVVECGPQCTGGFFTDWEESKDGWSDIGFPIAECRADGSFVVTKPEGTGGMVTVATVAEQVLYEVGDPAHYVLPDVVCDLSQVTLRQLGRDRVEVGNARGLAPTSTYKVSATWVDGYRCLTTLLVKGIDAAPKARAVARAILERTGRILARDGLGPYTETSVELLGAEDTYGPHARMQATREVVLKIAVRHPQAKALEIFAREIFPTSTSTVQGIAGVSGGRPKVQPVVRLFSFLLPKADAPIHMEFDGQRHAVAIAHSAPAVDPTPVRATSSPPHDGATSSPRGPVKRVPLVALAWARSGDKGDISNIAVLARRPEFVAVLREQLTTERVRQTLGHLVRGRVERFECPGLNGFNFLLHEALGGGGTASLRYDPQGKGHAQMLLDQDIEVPAHWLQEEGAAA